MLTSRATTVRSPLTGWFTKLNVSEVPQIVPAPLTVMVPFNAEALPAAPVAPTSWSTQGVGSGALVTVTLEKHARANIQEFEALVRLRPEIVECLAITGDGDFQLRIVARDLASFSRFLLEVIIPMPGIATTRSHIVLDQVKSTHALPI